MVKENQIRLTTGKTLYGLLFVVVLPLLLAGWAYGLRDAVRWPVPDWRIPGWLLAFVGLALMIEAMRELIVYGRGLPMNAYPPEEYVTQGLYAWFAHPIYLGANLICIGLSLALQSSSGLYIISPMLALMCLALIYGYERPSLHRRFRAKAEQHRPLFGLPGDGAQRTSWRKKIVMALRVLAQWFFVGYLLDYARSTQAGSGPFMGLFDPQQRSDLGSAGWLAPIAITAVLILVARDERQVRRAAVTGTLATWLGLFFYLIAPAFGLDVTYSIWPLAAINWISLAFALLYRQIWSFLRVLSERVANSRRDWLFMNGRIRVVNHSIYAFGTGAVAAAVAVYMTGNPAAVVLGVLCGVIGGAVYAQLSWGSGALLRPFGYWGAAAGGLLGIYLATAVFQIPVWQAALAAVLGAPFGQLLGRFRCMVQGCCHGTPTDERFGIRVWQDQSRVVVLSGLKGQWILPTQLYSILFNLLLGMLLWAMQLAGRLPASMIVGAYFALTGIERFAEDAYRGETQTRIIKGLKEPQWIAIISLLFGGAIALLPSYPQPAAGTMNAALVGSALAAGCLTALAMSVDFPASRQPFSRLSG